ncbi:MAG: large conductance mechanosensitive channel protein MscL [Clostridia bacterium]|nr:large conductance mechanosensitive channel protein MscL [Clostridia bacterium]
MAKEKKSGFFKDFKDFISKGNIIDMAVGVVIGGAFGKIVTGLVNFIINPVISLLTGGVSLENVKTVLVQGVEADEAAGIAAVQEVAIQWGAWIQTIIDFLLVALCIFLVLRAIVKAKTAAENLKKKEEEPAPEPEPEPEADPEPTEKELLAEIVALLKEKKGE